MPYPLLLTRLDYADVVMATGPVFYVPFQGSSVSEVVRSVKATVSATPPTMVTGPFPGANGYNFTLSSTDNDSFSIPTSTLYHPGDVCSVGGWTLVHSGGASEMCIIGLGAGDLNLYAATSTKSLVLAKQGTGNIYAVASAFSAFDIWVHVVFTKSGSGASNTCTAYVNGVVKAGTYTDRTLVAAAVTPVFGLDAGTSSSDYNGQLAHWAIWNRVLTPGEVSALYIAGVNQS